MSTYRKIHGRSIQAVTTDPTESVAEGQIWYNTNSDTFKTVLSLESFTSVSPLSTARDALQVGSVGTQTAGIAFGGRTHPPESFKNETEEYNGSGWSESGNLNDARFSGAGFGTQTAAVMAGGNRPGGSPDGRSDVEEYDGSSWTNATDIPAGRYGAMGAGTLTAGVVAGGATGTYPFTAQSTSFEYDGTNWTSGGTMNKGRWIGASGGPQTAALFFGGSDTTSSPNTTNTESYNGTAFTTLSALPTAVSQNMGSGDTSSAVSYGGGNPSAVTTAFTWDGSSWSTSPATLGTARDEGSSSGTGSAAITGGGSPPDAGLSIAEEYNKSTNIITAGAYSAGPTLDTNRTRGAGWGSMTSAVLAGGQNPSGLTSSSSEFNGSSWTGGGTMNSARQELGALGATESAGIVFGGEPNPLGTAVESYNGSSWTNTTSFPTAMKFGRMHAGPSTAGIVSGGSTPTGSGGDDSNGNFHDSHDWNGSSWTANTDMPFANQGGSAGSQTATVQSGNGYLVSPSIRMLDWNGSSWTAGASAVSGTDSYMVVGTQAAFVMGTAGGQTPPRTLTQVGDGTTISTGPNFAVDKGAKSGIGSSTSLNGAGGGEPGPVNTFEEFTGETTSVNVKTLTQS